MQTTMRTNLHRPVFLTLKEVMDIHEAMIQRYGSQRGVRDSALLESSITMPRSGIVGQYLHDGPFAMAAAYLFHFCRNRPFLAGNDRTAVITALVFLRINGFSIHAQPQEFRDLINAVVQHKADKHIVAWFFESHSRPSDEGPLVPPSSPLPSSAPQPDSPR